MKMPTRLGVLAVTVALVMGITGWAQDSGPRQEYLQQAQALRQQIDTILAGESADFSALLAKEDKTFEDLRAIAELRLELVKTSDAAQQVQAQLEQLRETFRSQHPDLVPLPHDTPRPELTDAQKQVLEEYRNNLKAKEQELNQLLATANARYAELLADPDKTREELQEMLELRRELIAASEEAQRLSREIHAMILHFRRNHPWLEQRFLGPAERVADVAKIKAGLTAVQELNDQINELLAAESPEYQALLAKEDKTAEDLQQLKALREQLLTGNEEAQKLAATAQLIRNRLHDERRELRLHRPGASPVRPGGATQTGGATDAGQ